ncbi:hypothetical protein BJ875DRAFT_503149 [Amylocarpus encephaloides]|uniref:AB hydrolase-1 domain-containing protein n=1 Tax=Amylocarpus encephaloides TaxID=45428 RepID=A0A9P8C7X4_9HELO|nr:hypothetical protein BJ875DRAFT_503149 [Amylocarpus encephaloides]
MPKPSVIFVPGSFSIPEHYDPIFEAVRFKGVNIRGIQLPSACAKPEGAPPTMYDDAAFIASEVQKEVDQDKDVILIPHSYGGVPTSESTKGLSKKEREAEGKKGGIIRLAYLTCLVPPVGKSAGEMLLEVPSESKLELKIDENGWMYHDRPDLTAAIAFSDLLPSEGEDFVRKFVQHSAPSFAGELTHPGYKDIPASWLFCARDKCIPARNQQEAIGLIERVSGRRVDVTRIEADHVPNASQPQLVIDWIVDVVAKA